jgi:acetyl-CoA acyltransferase/3-oxo-5,6-didehydrosuberyl-CoA/3-oxoadipyl-CoA thiolase
MSEAFILAGVRTAVGRYGGALSHIRTDGLFGQTMVAACAKAGSSSTGSRTSRPAA